MSKILNLIGGGNAFFCPGCEEVHAVNIRGPRWDYNDNAESPTFSPSIKVTYRHPKGYSNENPAPKDYDGEYADDICHSFVRDGIIQFLNDCTHSLAGQTVPIPEWPHAPGGYGGIEE